MRAKNKLGGQFKVPRISNERVIIDDILKLINQIENERGLGRNLHKEAFTGIDYLGNKVQFSSYVIWQEYGEIFKFNFNSDLVPFDSEILRRNRDTKISSII